MKSYRPYGGKRRESGIQKFLISLLVLVLAGAVCFGALLGVVLAGSRDDINGDCKIMVVLGCQVMPQGQPSLTLKDRLDTALDWLEEHPDTIVVVSGGQAGSEPVSEARCMADWLTANGFPAEQILLEDKSLSTNENLRFSVALLAAEGYDVTDNVMVVSNGFHLARIRMLWSRITGGQDNLSTLAAPMSHRPSAVRQHLREPLALVKSFLFDRGA